MKTDKENGFTLVEILAALTILGIVFISYMTIFPQMSNFNSKTEAKLVTMNLAKKELQEIQNGELKMTSENKISNNTESNKEIYEYAVGKGNRYICEVIYYKVPDLPKNTSAKSVSLNKIEIKIRNEGKIISETFGYVESE